MISWLVVDADTDEVLLVREPDVVLPTASVAKVLLLSELARALEGGEVGDGEPLRRDVTPRVGDSGLWHLMSAESLPVGDVALLVGAVSDNWATNVLLDRLGLDAVDRLARSQGLEVTALHDVVRDVRSPADPPTLSTGTAREWVRVMAGLHRRTWVSAAVSERVLSWLVAGVDHSMVASPLAVRGVDPLVAGPALVNKTGTDDDVRCDVGLVVGARRAVAYAGLGNGDPAELVVSLRGLGDAIVGLVAGD